MRKQSIVLEYQIQIPLVRRYFRHILTRQPDLSFGWLFESCYHSENRRFAAAAGAQQSQEFPFFNGATADARPLVPENASRSGQVQSHASTPSSKCDLFHVYIPANSMHKNVPH